MLSAVVLPSMLSIKKIVFNHLSANHKISRRHSKIYFFFFHFSEKTRQTTLMQWQALFYLKNIFKKFIMSSAAISFGTFTVKISRIVILIWRQWILDERISAIKGISREMLVVTQ